MYANESSEFADGACPPVEVLPGLFLGDAEDARRGVPPVQCVIDLGQHNAKEDLPAAVATHHSFDVADDPSADLAQFFEPIHAVVREALDRKQAVLVHCGAGISRGPTVVASYLVHHEGYTVDAAIGKLTELRSIVYPNLGFREQLRRYEQSLRLGDSQSSQPH